MARLACLDPDESTVKGQMFNVSYDNYKILDLAYEVRDALGGIDVKIEVDQSKRKDRSYRISVDKIQNVLGFKYSVSVAEFVATMVERIREWGYTDFSHPRYYNINWMMLLTEVESNLKKMGGLF